MPPLHSLLSRHLMLKILLTFGVGLAIAALL